HEEQRIVHLVNATPGLDVILLAVQPLRGGIDRRTNAGIAGTRAQLSQHQPVDVEVAGDVRIGRTDRRLIPHGHAPDETGVGVGVSTRERYRPRRKSIWATSQSSNVALNPGVTITPIDLLAGLEAGGVGIVGGTVTRIHAWLSFSGADTDANPSFIWGMTMWDKSSVGTTNPNVTSDFYID